jgi:hypothetical protein
MEDKTSIRIGDISNVSGQILAGNFGNVVANLNASGQTELVQMLTYLREVISTSKDLPNDKKQEQIEIINQIGDEATKSKPNKTLLKMLADGLIATLKVVPDVAQAIAAVAPVLTQLHI